MAKGASHLGQSCSEQLPVARILLLWGLWGVDATQGAMCWPSLFNQFPKFPHLLPLKQFYTSSVPWNFSLILVAAIWTIPQWVSVWQSEHHRTWCLSGARSVGHVSTPTRNRLRCGQASYFLMVSVTYLNPVLRTPPKTPSHQCGHILLTLPVSVPLSFSRKSGAGLLDLASSRGEQMMPRTRHSVGGRSSYSRLALCSDVRIVRDLLSA